MAHAAKPPPPCSVTTRARQVRQQGHKIQGLALIVTAFLNTVPCHLIPLISVPARPCGLPVLVTKAIRIFEEVDWTSRGISLSHWTPQRKELAPNSAKGEGNKG